MKWAEVYLWHIMQFVSYVPPSNVHSEELSNPGFLMILSRFEYSTSVGFNACFIGTLLEVSVLETWIVLSEVPSIINEEELVKKANKIKIENILKFKFKIFTQRMIFR